MIAISEKFNWPKILNSIAYSLAFFFLDIIGCQLLEHINMKRHWVFIPIALYIFAVFLTRVFRFKNLSLHFLSTVSLVAMILTFLSVNIDISYDWLSVNFELFAFIVIAMFFINLIITKNAKVETDNSITESAENKLFNLFYINTSKVHEIVMLIDNKIMKTVEREQISEELLKYNSSISVGHTDKWKAESGYAKEENSKKRVYENFDVKTTKSIMLRKIYDTLQKGNETNAKLNLGELTIFENIELQQRNIDDTVMLLNILQDSKIKDNTNETLEVNLNKMMDKMLDDFTIDYIFSCDKQGGDNNYIIQLPYKAIDNFENGYQHNDLQLGKLSLIGIYRGEIDFSVKDSVSSKFLELMSESYQNELQQSVNPVMKSSNNQKKQMDIQFDFNHKKLQEKLHLIDVIAIIQELNIARER